jgi:hypothetical protein
LGCSTVVYVWVHGAIEGAGEEFACGVERGVDGGGEAVSGSYLVGYFEGCALMGESCVVWVVSLHKLCELLFEVVCRGVFCVLSVDPFVCFGG